MNKSTNSSTPEHFKSILISPSNHCITSKCRKSSSANYQAFIKPGILACQQLHFSIRAYLAHFGTIGN